MKRQSPYLIRILSMLLLLCVSIPVLAQQTRVEEITAQQAEKAKHLGPYKPNKAENTILRIERWGLLSGNPIGFYPFIGSAFSGGGLALGPGYRRPFGDNAAFDIHGAWSIANYKLVDTSLKLPDFANGHVRSRVHAKYVDAGKVSFFGIGNDSQKDNKTSFSYSPKFVDIEETISPVRWFAVGGGVAYLQIDTAEGENPTVPSIEEVFSPAQAPGLGLDPTYVVGNLFAQIDTRQSPGYTTSGTYIRGDFFDYSDRDNDPFDFRRFDGEINQFIPILRANQIIALRALVSVTDVKDFNQVPFFLLPKLGGGEELRGFPDFRFRDRNRLLLTAEYRWTPSKFMDMAIFYETGKVAARRADIDLEDLHDCYGIGARFHTPASTAFRIEVAHSKEGTRIIFGGGPVF